jgi:signal transduction histidine kinase
MSQGISRPLLIFYILVAYILLQFTWWAWLLIDLNSEIVHQREYISRLFENNGADPGLISKNPQKDLRKRVLMVLGEGTVFLSLLIFGIYRIRSAFRKEFSLARQQKNFLLSITHEFKSPLAAVKLSLQTMQKRELEKTKQQEVIRRALIETERINLLVENALFASRLESENYDSYFESIDLSDFIGQLVKDYIERMDHEHEISEIIAPGISVRGDKMALTSMLYNLIENAEKYSPEGKRIEIALSRTNADALITIRDEGPGIPENERQKVFEKFYRIGNEDTRRTKGTGLGLFIVQHIVNLHKGSVKIRSNHPQGTVFEIRLPAEK